MSEIKTDGDPKIYIPFGSVKENMYPFASHGLCSFHLVTQPLQRLPLQGRDKPQVKRMIETCVEDWAYLLSFFAVGRLAEEVERDKEEIVLKARQQLL